MHPRPSIKWARPSRVACGACPIGVASPRGDCPFREARVPAGACLERQGDVPSKVWYLRTGRVTLRAFREDGDEASCAIRGPGSLLGLECLLGEPAAAEVACLTDVTACGLDGDGFRRWLGDLTSPLGVVLELGLREALQCMGERRSTAGTAVARVARFLIRYCDAHGASERPLAIPKQVMARTLGMRPETLSRALRVLREAGAIGPGRAVVPADRARLVELAQE